MATKLGGRVDISDEDFSPIGDDFVYQYSYNDKTGTMSIAASKRMPYDGSTAYGITISSRYDRDNEIREMVNFTEAVQKKSLAPFVKSVFYDSKSDCCSFELADGVEQFSPIANELLAIARETIGQFDWFGYVEHGKPLEEC